MPQGLDSGKAIEALKTEYDGHLEVEAMSLHASKGLEADFVVLGDSIRGSGASRTNAHRNC